MRVPFCLPTLGEEEIEAVSRVIRSGWLAPGDETEAFEKEFADYVGVKYAIFTNSCTSALKMAYKWVKETNPHLAYLEYDKNTFCATYSAAIEMGLNIYPFTESKKFTDSGIRVNMHYGGVKDETSCLIEDSAHRIEPNDPLVGKIRCYSFYITKNMTTGAGGMFCTNDKEIYERARLFWRDGLTTTTKDRLSGVTDYEVAAMSGGYDSTDMAAAMGRVQLRKLPGFSRRRNEIRDRYNAAFGREWMGNHLYCFDLGSPDRVKECREYLFERGIGSSYNYPGTGWTSVSLPIYPLLTNEDQDLIIATMKEGGFSGS